MLYNITMRNVKLNKETIFKILLFTAIIVAFFGLVNITAYKVVHNPTRNLNRIAKSKHNKLMIVAHPDDEMLWGGSRLIEDDYVVVCVTCGDNKKRLREIENELEITDDRLIILGVTDKHGDVRNNMIADKKHMKEQLERIMDLKDWDVIVTHNKEGEYGHIHHVITHSLVTNIVEKKNLTDKLYYFGKYYTKKNISEAEKNVPQISLENIKKKKEILKKCPSQRKTIERFSHMIPFEDWQKYNE